MSQPLPRPPVDRRVTPLWTGYVTALLVASMWALPATATELFDFEPRVLVDPGHSIKDHALIEVDGVWHFFYIRGDGSPGTASEDELGHAITTDFRRWTVLNPVIQAGPGDWEGRNVWAPHVIPTPPAAGAGWTMFYTGATSIVVQRMGCATTATSGLNNWIKDSSNPNLEPVDPMYLWDENLQFSAFRDPFYFEEGGVHHLLHTAVLDDPSAPAGRRGAVHHMTSTNFHDWTEQLPLATHNGAPNEVWHEIESLQLHEYGGFWHMFFTEQNLLGVHHLKSPQFDSGWDFNTRDLVDTGTAAEVTPVGPNQYLFSRYAPGFHLPTGEQYWALRVDELSFDVNGDPVVTRVDPLAADWPIRTGSAFEAAPTFFDNSWERGDTPANPIGNGYISSKEYYDGPLGGFGSPGQSIGDGATGTMRSRPFTLTGQYLRMFVGGGGAPGTFVAVVEDTTGIVIWAATGSGSPTLTERLWDIRPHQGTTVHVWIEDQSTLPGGYINVDHIEEIADPTSVPDSPQSTLGRLLRNHPNPFNPRTVIEWSQSVAGAASLAIYDHRGRLVRDFAPRQVSEGRHSTTWDGSDQNGVAVASGVYQVELEIDGRRADVRAVTLIR